jgi:outer membrane protein assembly factor BamB
VQSLDLETGERRWLQEFKGTQQVKDGDTVSRGAPTPTVDAEGVYVLFESGDLIALAHDGRERWRRSLVGDYGPFEGPHGYASSLAQHEGCLVVQVSHRGPSYLLAIDKASGRNIWKRELPPQTAWSSPLVVAPLGEPLILIGTGGSLRALALEDGKELWQVSDLKGITTPSPAWGDNLVVIGSSEPGFTQAFRLDAAGKLPSAEPAWLAAKTTCGYASPLVHRGHVYFVNKTGVAVCHDLATGEMRWTERLPGTCWATPLAAGERIYFVTKDGTTAVVRAGPTYELLAENELSFTDVVYAVAAADDSLLMRAGRSLVRITGNPPPRAKDAVPAEVR